MYGKPYGTYHFCKRSKETMNIESKHTLQKMKSKMIAVYTQDISPRYPLL